MKTSAFQDLLARVGRTAKSAARINRTVSVVDADNDDVPVGLHGVLAASEKLLAINRGLTPPDERDHPQYKKFYSTDKLLRERIRLDAGKLRQNVLRRVAKTKSLDGIHAFIFDPYAEGHLIGNPLSLPLEEINPMSLVEQSRRITMMGPGGIGSDDAITEDMQAVQPAQFGFVSPLESPESSRAGVDGRLAWGVKIGSDGNIYQRFKNTKTGKYHWLTPADVSSAVLKLPD